MSIRQGYQYKIQLDHLFEYAKSLSGEPERQSDWSKYLCVLVSGFLEVSIREIYSVYAVTKASPLVANFVEDHLREFQNPKMDKIVVLTRRFSPKWADSLEKATLGELKDAVDTIVANRHKIVHGESVGISYVRISNYYKNVNKVLDLIRAQCLE